MRPLSLTFAAVAVLAACEATPHVTRVSLDKGRSVTVEGRLEQGAPIDDLSFASRSTVACFPATQNEKFRGHHVFFATQLPERSIVEITVTPTDPSQDLSIYAYTLGTTTFTLPPELASCGACEAEHKWDRPKHGTTQGASRTVRLTALQNPYNVIVGVSGPAAARSGAFTVTFKTE